ncbi:alpha/beta fold hydrolase [Actinomadura rupiterrae]|uniref:alpha/beta fold hydrolase n=1 Tax=Actinomadura rupiterrae TaxID=559627 RepID=UPI0020A3668D|nr:alpha/beta fold hydrolase [Actinomadura rupiterrae]MCP2341909.1 pimeloyl-ACP methyl ester carboxylesterase [Actinomadura rupiterrae]
MPTVDVQISSGTSTVNYLVTGTGPGLVLVHGTGADGPGNWGPLIEALASRFTIVAPDLSGAGATRDAGGPILMDDLVRQVLAAADHAGLDRFHLAGHSLGGTVALAVAGTAPDRVISVVSHAAWAKTDPWMAFQFDLWARLTVADPELQARLLQCTAMGDATLRARSDADFQAATEGFTAAISAASDGFLRQVEADRAVDITALLPRITAPTVIISSADDRIVPPHHQRAVAEAVPHAQLVEVPGGHGLPFEDTDLFVRTFTEALNAVAAARSAVAV